MYSDAGSVPDLKGVSPAAGVESVAPNGVFSRLLADSTSAAVFLTFRR